MKKRRLLSAMIPLLVASLFGGVLLLFFSERLYGLVALGVTFVSGAVTFFVLLAYSNETSRRIDDIFRENDTVAGKIINDVTLPSLLFSNDGRIVWANAAFHEIYSGNDIKKLIPSLDTRFPVQAQPFERNGRTFQLMSMPIKREHDSGRQLTFQYWLDRTEALHYSRLYEEQMPTVALIYVDNYDELNANKQFQRNAVLSQVEQLIGKTVLAIDGVMRRYDSSKFFVVFEAKYLAELEKQRFSLLDAAREIDTGTGQPVTLSISVGVAERIIRSDEAARQGMELALGRGGDQAVVKRGASYSFFGGRHQMTTRNSRVKARLFAKALRQLIENSDQAFIMGHKQADMDCLGAALGLMHCVTSAGSRAYLVLDESNPTIESALSTMRQNPNYHDSVKTPEQAMQLLRSNSVVIIADTQREVSFASAELYQRASKVALVDHHRRPVDAIQNPTLVYLEAGASSTCEMITEVMQYFDDDLKPTAFEAGALLAGITVDTKHFAFNTGARTFEAASYLRRNGADNSTVKQMFQDDMQTYRDRARVVEGALIMEKGIAISRCPDGIENAALIAAQAADELISIRRIRASFVLASIDGVISISGRSLGDINVQIILEKLGGGGHLTVAATQIYNKTMDEAVHLLTQSIQSYLREVDKQ